MIHRICKRVPDCGELAGIRKILTRTYHRIAQLRFSKHRNRAAWTLAAETGRSSDAIDLNVVHRIISVVYGAGSHLKVGDHSNCRISSRALPSFTKAASRKTMDTEILI